MSVDTEQNQSLEKQLESLVGDPLFWFLPKKSLFELLREIQHDFYSLTWKQHSKNVRVDLATRSSSRKKFNEDAFLVLPFGEQYMLEAVIDGASSQKPIDGLAKYGVSGAWYISHLISLGFPQSEVYRELMHKQDLTAGYIMRVLNNWLYSQLAQISGVDYTDPVTIPGVAATFVLHNKIENSITTAHVADTSGCAVFDDGATYIFTPNQNKPFDHETMELAKKLQSEHACPLSELKKRSQTRDMLKAHMQNSFRQKINTPTGCGILNGMPQLVEHNLIFESKIDATRTHAIVLFSDGALLPHLEDSDDVQAKARLAQIALQTPLNQVLDQGFQILENDPNFERIPRLKQFDDQTLISIVQE